MNQDHRLGAVRGGDPCRRGAGIVDGVGVLELDDGVRDAEIGCIGQCAGVEDDDRWGPRGEVRAGEGGGVGHVCFGGGGGGRGGFVEEDAAEGDVGGGVGLPVGVCWGGLVRCFGGDAWRREAGRAERTFGDVGGQFVVGTAGPPGGDVADEMDVGVFV